MHSERGPARAGGFVLLEAVAALTIIALFAVALLGAVGAQVRVADKANGMMVARALAEDRLAALRVLDYDGLKDVPDSLQSGVFPSPFETYGWTARVEPVEDEYDLFAVEVVVQSQNDVFPISTMLHRPNPLNLPQAAQGGRGGDGGRGGQAGRGGRGGRGSDGGRAGRGGRGGDQGGVGRGGRGGGGRGGARGGGARGGGGRGGGGRGGARGGGGGGGGTAPDLFGGGGGA